MGVSGRRFSVAVNVSTMLLKCTTAQAPPPHGTPRPPAPAIWCRHPPSASSTAHPRLPARYMTPTRYLSSHKSISHCTLLHYQSLAHFPPLTLNYSSQASSPFFCTDGVSYEYSHCCRHFSARSRRLWNLQLQAGHQRPLHQWRCGVEARFPGGGASGGQDGARPRGQRQCAYHAYLAAWLERHRDPAGRHLIVGAAGAGHEQARGRAHRVRVPGLRLRLRPGDPLRGRPRRVQLPPVRGSQGAVHDGERVGGGGAGHHQGGRRRVARQRREERQPPLPELEWF